MAKESIEMSWPELNRVVKQCGDEAKLRRWLRDEMQRRGPIYRAMRIYGRLSAVRRKREVDEIRKKVA